MNSRNSSLRNFSVPAKPGSLIFGSQYLYYNVKDNKKREGVSSGHFVIVFMAKRDQFQSSTQLASRANHVTVIEALAM